MHCARRRLTAVPVGSHQGGHLQLVLCATLTLSTWQVAEEWALVRAEAQRAKAAADKPRQKAAGQLIAALKREIAALGARLPTLHARMRCAQQAVLTALFCCKPPSPCTMHPPESEPFRNLLSACAGPAFTRTSDYAWCVPLHMQD